MESEPLSAKGLAIKLNTNARTVRKFFRSSASPVEAVGQGHRYEVTEEDFDEIKEAFNKWRGIEDEADDA